MCRAAHLRDLLPETAIASVLLAGVAWMLPIPLTLLVMRRQDCVLLRGLATTPSRDAPALKGGTRRTMQTSFLAVLPEAGRLGVLLLVLLDGSATPAYRHRCGARLMRGE